MKSSISPEQLKAHYENDNLAALYDDFLKIYKENTNGNELAEPLKREIQHMLFAAPDLDTILERLEGLVETYQQYFHN